MPSSSASKPYSSAARFDATAAVFLQAGQTRLLLTRKHQSRTCFD